MSDLGVRSIVITKRSIDNLEKIKNRLESLKKTESDPKARILIEIVALEMIIESYEEAKKS